MFISSRENRKVLKIVGIHRPGGAFLGPRARNGSRTLPEVDIRLEGVTSLDCSIDNRSRYPYNRHHDAIFAVTRILPSLKTMDLSNFGSDYVRNLMETVAEHCSTLSNFTWNGSRSTHSFSGDEFSHFANLTHLSLDGAQVSPYIENNDYGFVENAANSPDRFLLMKCTKLESLSIKNMDVLLPPPNTPRSRHLIIEKMIRRQSTLRRLRSDLPVETVAILKSERPYITFVSD